MHIWFSLCHFYVIVLAVADVVRCVECGYWPIVFYLGGGDVLHRNESDLRQGASMRCHKVIILLDR